MSHRSKDVRFHAYARVSPLSRWSDDASTTSCTDPTAPLHEALWSASCGAGVALQQRSVGFDHQNCLDRTNARCSDLFSELRPDAVRQLRGACVHYSVARVPQQRPHAKRVRFLTEAPRSSTRRGFFFWRRVCSRTGGHMVAIGRPLLVLVNVVPCPPSRAVSRKRGLERGGYN